LLLEIKLPELLMPSRILCIDVQYTRYGSKIDMMCRQDLIETTDVPHRQEAVSVCCPNICPLNGVRNDPRGAVERIAAILLQEFSELSGAFTDLTCSWDQVPDYIIRMTTISRTRIDVRTLVCRTYLGVTYVEFPAKGLRIIARLASCAVLSCPMGNCLTTLITTSTAYGYS